MMLPHTIAAKELNNVGFNLTFSIVDSIARIIQRRLDQNANSQLFSSHTEQDTRARYFPPSNFVKDAF